MVKSVISAAEHGGATVKRPWLGAKLQNVSKDIADSLGLDRPVGAAVVGVTPNSPAAKAGLKRGDVLLKIDGQDVDDAEGVGFRLAVKPLGGVASLSLTRDGKTVVAPLELAAAPETPPRDVRRIKSRSPFQGAEVVNLSPAVVEEMSLQIADDGPPKGVIVDDVAADSLAANFGVQKGDIIVDVNDTAIKTTRDLEDVCAQRARYWDLTISRDGQVIRTRIGG
jgi:S1-C subfamily serine protease